MTEELREELDQAALATQQAFVAARGATPGFMIDLNILCTYTQTALLTVFLKKGEDHPFGLPSLASNLEDLLAEKVDRAKEREEENKLSPKVRQCLIVELCLKPIQW